MKRLFIVLACCWFRMANAQTPSLYPPVDEVQVIIYVDLEPGGARNGSALLVDQVEAEVRSEGCQVALPCLRKTVVQITSS